MHSFRHSRFNSRTPGGVRQHSHVLVLTSLRFQFTHPGRGATSDAESKHFHNRVSIHAPREGCDYLRGCHHCSHGSFNSRTPGGVRLGRRNEADIASTVSIHAPREGCDASAPCVPRGLRVSIHAPREGCDVEGGADDFTAWSFNSRTPGGVRPPFSVRAVVTTSVSIHAPREGCDSTELIIVRRRFSFNSRTPGGVRQVSIFF